MLPDKLPLSDHTHAGGTQIKLRDTTSTPGPQGFLPGTDPPAILLFPL